MHERDDRASMGKKTKSFYKRLIQAEKDKVEYLEKILKDK